MNKKEVEKYFKETYYPEYKEKDKHAQRLAWDFLTDGLCKSGRITQKQYETWERPNFIK